MKVYCEPCVSDLPLSEKYYADEAELMSKCCSFFGVTKEYIIKNDTKRERALIRQMCVSVFKIYTLLSLKSIGHIFNGRHHSTIIHSINTVSDLCDTDKAIKSKFEELKKFIRK